MLSLSSKLHNLIPTDFAEELDTLGNIVNIELANIKDALKSEDIAQDLINDIAFSRLGLSKTAISANDRINEIYDHKLEIDFKPLAVKREDYRDFPKLMQVAYLGKVYSFDPEDCLMQLIEDGVVLDVTEEMAA